MVDDVIYGCVSEVGAQSTNLARNIVLTAGWPYTIPGVTLDRQCSSSQQAVHFAANQIGSGVHEIVVAGGTELMSQIPLGVEHGQDLGLPFTKAMQDQYDLTSQGLSAERIADEVGHQPRRGGRVRCRKPDEGGPRPGGRAASRGEMIPVAGKKKNKNADGTETWVDAMIDFDEGIRAEHHARRCWRR